MWPEETDISSKLYGNLEELQSYREQQKKKKWKSKIIEIDNMIRYQLTLRFNIILNLKLSRN